MNRFELWKRDLAIDDMIDFVTSSDSCFKLCPVGERCFNAGEAGGNAECLSWFKDWANEEITPRTNFEKITKSADVLAEVLAILAKCGSLRVNGVSPFEEKPLSESEYKKWLESEGRL